ncbi:acetyl-CoA carboxylase biotin carboxyl carrier protein [Aerococcus viridans]|uniref:Biotin carboxyl carrier protein of acetyl-CoA carboxylase n=1 Tax=Aerococcus viridans TaxID=1377 RepID=A0A2J9PPR2_9LACT|nr:acetyl-CoA carboxylase biotin carboxyl carrier protein [Aerococcus viridans]PNL92333.1 acetyl-CoA carboxylase biotin carboxyl carrier protein [Aerococcus viridans]
MKHEEIKDLISQIDSSTIQEFSFQTQADSLYISKIKERQTQTENTVNTSTNQHAITNAEATSTTAAKETTSQETTAPATEKATPSAPTMSAGKTIDSPLVGVVYLAKNPDHPAFKKVGDSVEAGETVCIVEAMKVMNEIPADISGTVVNVLVEDGQVVEFGQPLFEISE